MQSQDIKPPRWLFRLILILAFVPIMLLTACGRIWTELSRIPRYVWLDWRGECELLRTYWKDSASW